MFNLRPPRPKLQFVWDVKIVFSYLEEKGSNNILPDKILSQKLLILLLLLGGQRMNTVFNFEVDNIFINTECAIFSPDKVLKHSEKTGPIYLLIISTKRTLCSRHSTRIFNPKEVESVLQHKKSYLSQLRRLTMKLALTS